MNLTTQGLISPLKKENTMPAPDLKDLEKRMNGALDALKHDFGGRQ